MTAAARLRHLEHMVQVLKAQVRREESGGADVPASSSTDTTGVSPMPPSPSVRSISQETQSNAASTTDHPAAKGTVGAMADQTRYVEVIHWEAVLDEVGTHGVCLRISSTPNLVLPR